MSAPAKTFAEIFNSGYWEGQQMFTDGTLKTDDGTAFKIHRVVLSQRSGYFRAIFSFNLKQEAVIIPNVESKLLESLLIYIYTGTITIDVKNVWNLMIAADYLLLDDLLQSCQSFAVHNMTTIKCLPSLSLASQIERLTIAGDCYRYALVHFEDILETSNAGWYHLPFEVFKNLLRSNSLNVSSERSVWKAIVQWTEASNSERLPHVGLLLSCLRLQMQNDDEEGDGERTEEENNELAVEILSHTIITNNPHCSDILLSAQIYYMSKWAVVSQYARSEARIHQELPPSCSPRVPNQLYIIARHTLTPSKYVSELFLTYDSELDFWKLIGETDFFIDTMVQIGQFIYLFNVKENLSLIFDLIENVFLPIGVSPWPCDNCCIIAFNENLYSIGGSRRRRHTRDMAYRYEFERNRWINILMTNHIFIYSAVGLNNLIYLIGKSVGHGFEPEPILICQTYDPETDDKISIPSPNVFRQRFSFVAFHEQVFLIAGENDGQYLKSVEVYNPVQGTWVQFPDLPFQYFFPKAVVVDDKLFVFENNEDTRCFKVAPPVYWDEDAHRWQIIDESSPFYCMERYSFLVLDDRQLVRKITAGNRGPGSEWQRILQV